ncbi:MAG: ATP-binding protein [Myxococcota bacterium]
METTKLQQFLSFRYQVALALIALLIVVSFGLVNWVLSAQLADAPTINVTGRQRMLSQRVALFTLRVLAEPDAAIRDRHLAALERAVDEMGCDHSALIQGDAARGLPAAPDRVRDLYFGETQLDARVRSYLEDARAVVALQRQRGTSEQPQARLPRSENRESDPTAGQATALLRDLDKVVTQHEAAGSERVRWLQVAQFALLICTFILLWLESRTIFQPMVRWVSTYTDTLQKEVEDRRAAEARASEATRAQGRFLAKMSHELRTPLNAVIGYAELLSETQDPIERKECTDRILQAASHQLNMINDLLDLERVERGGWTFEIREINVSTLIDDVVNTTQPQCQANGNRLVVEVAPNLPPLHSDRVRLSQILMNLVGNAGKFTENGLIQLQVRSATSNPRLLEFTVQDTGPGIREEDRRRIFEKFIQVDDSPTRRQTGAGLGLAISKELVEALGGSIRVTSELGTGSAFTVLLPFERKKNELK